MAPRVRAGRYHPAVIHLEPEFLLIDGSAVSGQRLSVDPQSGTIVAIGPSGGPASGTLEVLPGRLLMPAFHNAHSHAFQRLLRGRVEHRHGPDDDFWSWREAMYHAVLHLDVDDIRAVTRLAFVEMALAGYATVGEFHYLHHDRDGRPYADRIVLSRIVAEAAEDAGIGLCLLRTAYQRAGPGLAPEPAQRRFSDPHPEPVLADMEALSVLERTGPRPVRVGIAPHSVRALDRPFLEALGVYAQGRRIPVHAHVAEQPKEGRICQEEHGCSAVELLARTGLLNERLTAVHATFLSDADVAMLGAASATACLCPTTEANLGDGLPRLRDLVDAGVTLAIGTDSQCRLDPFAEIRRLEDGERLRLGRRNVLAPPRGGPTAPALFAAGARGGARAMQWDSGRIEVGARADLVAVRLDDHALDGVLDASDVERVLPAAVVLHAVRPWISDLWVGGGRVVHGGHHPQLDSARREFRRVVRDLGPLVRSVEVG